MCIWLVCMPFCDNAALKFFFLLYFRGCRISMTNKDRIQMKHLEVGVRSTIAHCWYTNKLVFYFDWFWLSALFLRRS